VDPARDNKPGMYDIEQIPSNCSEMKNNLDKQTVKEDRRTVRTKKYLADALKQLVLEKNYDDITIQEIIDLANVGRSTFYTHYESKEQLLVGNINFQEKLINAAASDDSPMGINISYLFAHSEEHISLYKAMTGNRSIEIIGNYFMELCTSKIMDHAKRHSSSKKKNQPMLRYKAEAAAGGIIRMMFKWLDDGAKVPAEEMIAYAKKILNDLMLEER